MDSPNIDKAGNIRDSFRGKTINQNRQATNKIEPNILQKYASFNYIWTLSVISREELRDPIQVGKKIHDVIAKSSGIGKDGAFRDFNQNVNDLYKGNADVAKTVTKEMGEKFRARNKNADTILRRGHDIFFEKVNITAVHRPNEQRKMMNFTKIEMELHEPFGVTLYEKLRAGANNNRFADHIDCPYLLTLEFRGYDNQGQPLGNVITVRHLPIKITNSEMEIDASGTRYIMTAVPWTEFAMTDRFLYTRGAGSLLKTVTDNVVDSTLSAALASLSKILNEQQNIEVDRKLRQYVDQYIIEVEDGVSQTSDNANFILKSVGAGFTLHVRPNVSIAKLITDLVQQADGYRKITDVVKQYWRNLEQTSKVYDAGTDLQNPEPYVPWFKIKTTIVLEEPFDNITKQHKKTIIFRVIPYKVHVMNFTVPGLSASGLWGKSVRKAYKYIFTGENTEILDLKINYKFGYYQARLYDGSRKTKDTKDLSLQDLVERYGGTVYHPEALLPLRSYPTTQKAEDGATSDGKNQTQVDEFYSYLTNPLGDMVNVQMTIMGDPAFIGQDFALPIKTLDQQLTQTRSPVVTEQSEFRGKQYNDKTGCFNFDDAEAFVTVDFKFPTDINENLGVMDFQNLEDVSFSGLYKVVQVESLFDRGKFTQVLDLVRYNNQGKQITPVVSYTELEKKAEADQRGSDVYQDGA